MNLKFNNEIITPETTTTKSWLLRHAGHRKIQDIMKEQNGLGPDVRAVFCYDCKEIFIMGAIE